MSCEPQRIFMSDAITHEVGNPAPAFECQDSSGNVHSSASYQADGKTLILYFYPRDSTPGCTTQACDFRDNIARLSTEGYVVLGVSKDSEGSHEKFISKQDLNFPLLMDRDGELHEKFGTWRLKKNYGREYMGCSRSTFVVSPDGNFAWLRYNVKAKGHVGMLMRELGLGE
jgi:peroxiredoxin Q/BCP